MSPKVNILVATYNGEKYLAELLDSLLAQTYPNIQIFVLDDGSSDKTNQIIKQYTEKGIKDCTNCTLPHQRKNYDYIIGKFKEIVEITKLDSE